MTAPCYPPPVDEAQRTELLARHRKVAQVEADYKTALATRDAYIVELRRAGIGATEQARILSEGRDHPINRVSIARIAAPAAEDGRGARTTRATPEQTAHLRALQAAVDDLDAAIDTARDRRGDYSITLEAEGVGATEQAGVLEVNRSTVQRVLDEHRKALRRITRLGDQ